MDKPAACGAEALGPAAEELAEEHQWTLVKEFKLHVHPPHMKEKLSLRLDGKSFYVNSPMQIHFFDQSYHLD